MMTSVLGLAAILGLALAARHWSSERRRLLKLSAYGFPDYLGDAVGKTYPHLGPDEIAKVLEGLRQFFTIAIRARGRPISMPSQAVDEAWHAFILSTQAYADFCHEVLGRFLHHRPAAAMFTPRLAQEGIRRSWRLACRDAGINPESPGALPLLFALDGALAIPGGFTYTLKCKPGDGQYCASHITPPSCGSGGGCSAGGGTCGGGGHGGCSGCGGD